MASRADAERWLALEFVGAVMVRTIAGFRQQNSLLGPQTYAAIMVAYGMLSILVLSDTTADLAAVFGFLLLLAILLRPTATGVLGSDTAGAIASFARNVGANPPSIARGVPKPGAAQPSSTSSTSSHANAVLASARRSPAVPQATGSGAPTVWTA